MSETSSRTSDKKAPSAATPGGAHRAISEAFLTELRDTYDAEKRIFKVLPKMAKASRSRELKAAFERHLEETQEQITRLEQVFADLGERVRGTRSASVSGIIDAVEETLTGEMEDEAIDASLAARGNTLAHHEISAYGTLIAWAEALGHDHVVEVLRETLDEERAAEKSLQQAVAPLGTQRDEVSHDDPADDFPAEAADVEALWTATRSAWHDTNEILVRMSDTLNRLDARLRGAVDGHAVR